MVLDLNGKTIRCQQDESGDASTIGLTAAHRTSVTVRNGTITGCRFGIVADHSTAIVIEDVNLSENSYVGAEPRALVSPQYRAAMPKFSAITGYTAERICHGHQRDWQPTGSIEDNTF